MAYKFVKYAGNNGGNAGGGGGTQLYKHAFAGNIAGIMDIGFNLITPSATPFDILNATPETAPKVIIAANLEYFQDGVSMGAAMVIGFDIATINGEKCVAVSLAGYEEGSAPMEFFVSGYGLTITGEDVVTPL